LSTLHAWARALRRAVQRVLISFEDGSKKNVGTNADAAG
jgi:hypothetical protein